MIRTFVAIHVPPTPELEELLGRLAAMGRAVRPVRPDALHITLKFLGDTPESRVKEVAETVQQAAGRFGAFELQLQDILHMPERRPRVVYAGVGDSDTLMAEIAAALEEALEPLGFLPEERPFRAHLTLARIKARVPAELDQLECECFGQPLGSISVDQIELIRSDLGHDRARYTTLAEGSLAGSSPAG